MKKYCPFCESELSESLWCEQCKRKVILYNTHCSAAVRNADEHNESDDPATTRSTFVSDDITTVNNTFPTDNIAVESSSTDDKVNAAKKPSTSDNISVPQNNNPAYTYPHAVPAHPMPSPARQKPKRDMPKLVLLSSMLLVCLILCLVVCTQLIHKSGTEPTQKTYSAKEDTPGEKNTKHPSRDVVPDDTAGKETIRDSGNTDTDTPDDMANKFSDNYDEDTTGGKAIKTYVDHDADTADDKANEASDNYDADTADDMANEASDNYDADTSATQEKAESTEKTTTNSAEWKKLEALTPLDLQIYGDTKYYYYSTEDIEALGQQCTYYHLGITYDQASAEIVGCFGQDALEDSPLDETYFNSYVDSGSEYYTSFQQILSYDCGDVKCSINYDTGSGMVHFVSFSGTNIEDYVELILTISASASPDHTLSQETLRDQILSAKDALLNLDPPDTWHEEYIYQDSCISLSMTYSGDIYELQLNSRQLADDMAQNTLSISRPKY